MEIVYVVQRSCLIMGWGVFEELRYSSGHSRLGHEVFSDPSKELCKIEADRLNAKET